MNESSRLDGVTTIHTDSLNLLLFQKSQELRKLLLRFLGKNSVQLKYLCERSLLSEGFGQTSLPMFQKFSLQIGHSFNLLHLTDT